MATILRFKKVDIESRIRFAGRNKSRLKYTVRSLSLVPDLSGYITNLTIPAIPEIFWQ
ncbi:MAG TPA: hypothetical protein PKG48_01355 [Bacteroidales bacterium]|nr:hypothetical protein [Bacteroidales bacterium]HPS63172.1 hypothetical protein [Bacteroidales bacterium]